MSGDRRVEGNMSSSTAITVRGRKTRRCVGILSDNIQPMCLIGRDVRHKTCRHTPRQLRYTKR